MAETNGTRNLARHCVFLICKCAFLFSEPKNGNNAKDEPYILTSFEALNKNVSNANLTIPLDDGTGTSW